MTVPRCRRFQSNGIPEQEIDPDTDPDPDTNTDAAANRDRDRYRDRYRKDREEQHDSRKMFFAGSKMTIRAR
jgi:hypothetical protein